jgi:hypothetical protein
MDVNNGVARSVETTPAGTWHVASPHRVTSLADHIAP